MFGRVILVAVILLVTNSYKARAGDTTYLLFVWTGDVSKPYHELFFYVQGTYDSTYLATPYGSFAVSPGQLDSLVDLYVPHTELTGPPGQALPFPSKYEAVLITNCKCVTSKKAATQQELLYLYHQTELLLKDYERKDDVLRVWDGILRHLGIEKQIEGRKLATQKKRKVQHS